MPFYFGLDGRALDRRAWILYMRRQLPLLGLFAWRQRKRRHALERLALRRAHANRVLHPRTLTMRIRWTCFGNVQRHTRLPGFNIHALVPQMQSLGIDSEQMPPNPEAIMSYSSVCNGAVHPFLVEPWCTVNQSWQKSGPTIPPRPWRPSGRLCCDPLLPSWATASFAPL